MSGRFNYGMDIIKGYDWVWHLTNVSFKPRMVEAMLEHVAEDVAAIHPAFGSDHPHLNPKAKDGASVPFVEWTAPLVSVEAWENVGRLQAEMGYWGFDLDWSYRAKRAGYKLIACTTLSLEHDYLRNKHEDEHTVTRLRRAERAKTDEATEALLRATWGDDWLEMLWPTHPYVAQKRKYLHKAFRKG
jgi:GT2 family glycosyltransferase